MQSYDIKFSELKDALYEVAPFSIKDTDALIKKYNLKSDAVRIFNRYNGDEKKIKDFLKEQANTHASLSKASSNSFFSGIRKPITVPTKRSTKPNGGIVEDDDLASLVEKMNNTSVINPKKNYTMDAAKKAGIAWTDISRRPDYSLLSYGPEFKLWVDGEIKRRKSLRSSAGVDSFLTSNREIHKHSTVHKGDMRGGNKSRRNTRTYRHSKKHKRVRHTRRKRTRRNHRSRRHR